MYLRYAHLDRSAHAYLTRYSVVNEAQRTAEGSSLRTWTDAIMSILSYTTVSALMVSRQFHKIPNSTIVHTTTLYLVHV